MGPIRRNAPLRSAGRVLAAGLPPPWRRLLPTLQPILLAWLLAGCATAPPAPPSASPATSDWPGGFYAHPPLPGRVFRIDPTASQLTVLVFRGGALAAQGHDHAVSTSAVAGAAFLPDEGLDQARVDLRLPVDALEVDRPEVRSRLGPPFAARVPEGARAGTRRNLLGPRLLDAERHPFLELAATVATGALPRLALDVEVVVRGERRRLQQPVAVQVDAQDGALRVRGALALRHADLGLTPFSALGGLLRVADPLLIEFDLVAREEPASHPQRHRSSHRDDHALYSPPPNHHHAPLDPGRHSREATEQR